ncbi:MAG: DUF5655 domain-containing protein [Pseudomonadota bacterium]
MDDAHTVEAYLARSDIRARPVFEAFRAAALQAGDGVTERVSRTMVSWKNHRAFAGAYLNGQYVECTIDLTRAVAHPHLTAAFHSTNIVITHRFTLTAETQVDDDIRALLAEACKIAGPGARRRAAE